MYLVLEVTELSGNIIAHYIFFYIFFIHYIYIYTSFFIYTVTGTLAAMLTRLAR